MPVPNAFTAAKQTTFTAPIEGTDATTGLTVTRSVQTAASSAVLTINSLPVGATLSGESTMYGLYVDGPQVQNTFTVNKLSSALVKAPTRTGLTSAVTNAYSLRLEAPTVGDTTNYSLLSEGKILAATALDSSTTSFSLVDTTATTVYFARGASTNLIIGPSGGTTTIQGDLKIGSSKSYSIGTTVVLSGTSLGTTVVGSSLTSLGTISTGIWQGTPIGVDYGGTGSNNGSITGAGALTFAAGGTNQDVVLDPSGTGAIDASSARIKNVGYPDQSTDAATKAYVDAARSGLDIKDSVHVATTTNMTEVTSNSLTSWDIDGHTIRAATFVGSISGTTLTVSTVNSGYIDEDHTLLGTGIPAGTYIVKQNAGGTVGGAGTYTLNNDLGTVNAGTLKSGSRVLVKGQTNKTQNGIWVTQTTTWVRAWDFPSGISAYVTPGSFVFVSFGTTYGSSGFVLQDPAITVPGQTTPIDVDTTSIGFVQFSGAGSVTEGYGIVVTGNEVAVDTSVIATLSTNQNFVDKGSYNKVTITQPSNSATLTIADTKKLETKTGDVVFTAASSSGSDVTLPASGTLATVGGALGSPTVTTINGLTISNNGTNTLNIAAGKTLRVDNNLKFTATESGTPIEIAFGGTNGTVALVGGALGAATATTLNGLTITNNGANTLNIAASKTLKVDNNLTFTATESGSAVSVGFGTGGTVVYNGGALGAATATSINGLTISSSTGTLTIANGKTVTFNNTLTFSASNDSASTINFGTGGTVVFSGGALGAATATSINGLTITTTTGGTLTVPNNTTLSIAVGSVTLSASSNLGSSVTLPASGTLIAQDGALGNATATTINKVTITTPANGATLTLVNNKTFTTKVGDITLNADTGGSSDVTLPASGTLAVVGGSLGAASVTSINGLAISSTSSATLTIATSKTFNVDKTIKLTATNDATIATIPAGALSGSDYLVTLVDTVTTQSLSGKTLTAIPYTEFASQGSKPTAPSPTNALQIYNKSGQIYTQGTSGTEYKILSQQIAPYFNLGSSSLTTGQSYRRIGNYILYGNTSNATPLRLTSAGAVTADASNSILLPSGTQAASWLTKIYVTSYSANSAAAGWEITALFRKGNTAGSTTLVGDPIVIAASDSTDSALQVTVSYDNTVGVTQDSIDITVQGLAGKAINWLAYVTTIELGSASASY